MADAPIKGGSVGLPLRPSGAILLKGWVRAATGSPARSWLGQWTGWTAEPSGRAGLRFARRTLVRPVVLRLLAGFETPKGARKAAMKVVFDPAGSDDLPISY